MSTTETTTQTIRPEVSHDLHTAELAERHAAASLRHNRAVDTIRRMAGEPRKPFVGSFELAIEEALNRAASYEVARIHETVGEAAAAQSDAFKAHSDFTSWEQSYTGWSRFFLVTSSDGHIHSSMECSTCFASTTYSWLPTLSGLTMAEAVAEHGEILCSVCFPDAPVAWTNGESNAKKADRAEREAAKAERAAKKLAKQLLPDGSPLVLHTEGLRGSIKIETLHAAKTWLTDAASWNRGRADADRHPSFPADAEALVAEAVAAKLGTTAEVELAAAAKRAAKRDGV